MENKYNELEKLNQLKANGTITDAEFEVEKHKILNNVKKTHSINTKIKPKIFFIIAIIGLIITIPLFIRHNYYAELWENLMFHNEKSYLLGLNDDEISKNSREERDRLEQKVIKIENTRDTLKYSAWASGGIATISFIVGIVFKVKEKKK